MKFSIRRQRTRSAVLGGVALAALGLGAGAAHAQEGNFFTNMLKFGGTTVPPSQPADTDPPYCPTVEVPEGGAAIRSGEGAQLRHQVALGRVARECTKLQDGSLSVKVGVEGQVLLGPAGSPGRFEAPVSFAIKANGKVLTTRVRRVAVSVPAGQAQGLFSLIEDSLPVPAGVSQNYDIEVKLGAAPQRAAPKARRPAAAAAATSEDPVKGAPKETGE